MIAAEHLVIGEQTPILAIRRPEQLLLWCAFLSAYFFFGSRVQGDSLSVKITISSPVTVLMS